MLSASGIVLALIAWLGVWLLLCLVWHPRFWLGDQITNEIAGLVASLVGVLLAVLIGDAVVGRLTANLGLIGFIGEIVGALVLMAISMLAAPSADATRPSPRPGSP